MSDNFLKKNLLKTVIIIAVITFVIWYIRSTSKSEINAGAAIATKEEGKEIYEIADSVMPKVVKMGGRLNEEQCNLAKTSYALTDTNFAINVSQLEKVAITIALKEFTIATRSNTSGCNYPLSVHLYLYRNSDDYWHDYYHDVSRRACLVICKISRDSDDNQILINDRMLQKYHYL